jgi:uncharacterized protein (DUF1330 family)
VKKLAIGVAAVIFLALAATGYAQKSQSQPPGYLVANYEITDLETYQRYLEAAAPLVSQYNGTITIFNLNSTAVEGNPRPVMAIAEFPSLAAVERYYHSPEYSEVKQLRIASTVGWALISEGVVPPQP